MTHFTPAPSGPAVPPPMPPPVPSPRIAAAVLAEADQILTGQLPTLGQIVRDAEHYGAQMIAVLGRQWDPASGPSQEVSPWGPVLADMRLAAAVVDVRTALRVLHELTHDLPPAGSAVKFPVARSTEGWPGPMAPSPQPPPPDPQPN